VGSFDNIDHVALLEAIGAVPGKELIKQWLKAGYVDKKVFHETKSGTPQGGVISPVLAKAARQTLITWLGERGLVLSPEKTKIVHLTEGFNFLGFNVRLYTAPRTSKHGYKLLIKPSEQSVKRMRDKLRGRWHRLQGSNASALTKERFVH
jgi:RNA-directed DNA polymerase